MQQHHEETLGRHIKNLEEDDRQKLQDHVDALDEHRRENPDADHEKHNSYTTLAKWGAGIVGLTVQRAFR